MSSNLLKLAERSSSVMDAVGGWGITGVCGDILNLLEAAGSAVAGITT